MSVAPDAPARAAVHAGSARLGPSAALLPIAAVAVALGYFPSLDAPFIEPKLAVLVVAGALGLGGFIWTAVVDRWWPRLDRAIAAAAVALLLAMSLSTAVALRRGPPGAPYAGAEIVRVLALIGVALAVAAGDAEARRRLFEAIHAAAGLVSLIGLIQHLRLASLPIPSFSVPGSTFGNRNLAAEAVAMAIPFSLALIPFQRPGAETRRAPRAGLGLCSFLALEICFLAVARARGAWLGGALGIVVFFFVRRPRVSRTDVALVAAVGVAALLAAVVPGRWTAHDARDEKRFEPAARVVHEAVDPTSPVVRTRFGLWRRTLAMYRDAPVWGVGPGNFPVRFPRYAEPNASADHVLSPTIVPGRAHDDLLERLAETGPLGAGALLALYAALGVAALRRAGRARREGHDGDVGPAAAGAGSVAAFAGAGLTGFPFAMPATVFLLGVALGVLADDETSATSVPTSAPGDAGALRLAAAGALAAILVTGAAWWSARRIEASFLLARAATALRAGDPARALPDLARAAAAAPADMLVALQTSAAALRAGRAADAEAAARHALALEPDSANAWEALARARLAAGDARAADEAAARALAILHDYPGALATRAEAARQLGAR